MKNDRWYTATELAAEIRERLKKEFPDCKFSVRKQDYAGGRSITVCLMAAPFEVLLGINGGPTPEWFNQSAQLNHYQFSDDEHYKHEWDYETDGWTYVNNGYIITAKCFNVMRRVVEITNVHNWDNSDPQIDWHDVNFYTHFEIGNGYDKPFKRTALKEKGAKVTT